MGHKLKTLLTTFGVIIAVMWHHQATLFQRQVRENLSLLRAYVGPTLQLGDIIISKYLFKVEFKKPQLDINNQSLEKIKESLQKNTNLISKFLQKQLATLSPTFRLDYRLADRLVVTYNPFWHELTLNSIGDSELSLQTASEKIDLLAPDHNDLNQGKIKISLPAPAWLQKIKAFFFKDTVSLLNINSSCRNLKIVTASNQEAVYTQDYNLTKVSINEEWFEGKHYYIFSLNLRVDNAHFSPTLTKMWPFLESYVLGNKTKQQETYKVKIESDEGKAFINKLISQLEHGQEIDWKSVLQNTPTIKVEVKNNHKNDALAYAFDYLVDYQPHKNYVKASCDSTFQAYSVWPIYLEKLCAFYQGIATYFQDPTQSPLKLTTKPLWYSLLANLSNKGEINSSCMLELNTANPDQIQAQGAFKIGLEKTGIAVKGDYKIPHLLSLEVDFEDPETFLNKAYSYVLNSLEGASRKVAEIILPNLKNTLIENIQKLNVAKNESTLQVYTIPIQYNNATQSLEVAGKPMHHEFLDIAKMIIGLLGQHDFLQTLKKLVPSSPLLPIESKPVIDIP